MPEHGPGFRPEQHRWGRDFPFWGTGALNRLTVHPSIIDFAERALQTSDIRVYQTGMSAKFTGDADYEQPMHTDRNHSLLPAVSGPPFFHVETFLYLSDVDDDCAPTHVVSRPRLARPLHQLGVHARPGSRALHEPNTPRAESAGRLMAYRNDVFHRGVDITRRPGARGTSST